MVERTCWTFLSRHSDSWTGLGDCPSTPIQPTLFSPSTSPYVTSDWASLRIAYSLGFYRRRDRPFLRPTIVIGLGRTPPLHDGHPCTQPPCRMLPLYRPISAARKAFKGWCYPSLRSSRSCLLCVQCLSAIPGWLRCPFISSSISISSHSNFPLTSKSTMETHGELVDLSLFAESPTRDWRFTALDVPPNYSDWHPTTNNTVPPSRQNFQSQRHAGSNPPTVFNLPANRCIEADPPPQLHDTYHRRYYDPPDQPVVRPLPRSYTLKPLPALPSKKLCRSRPSKARSEVQTRCILQRLKKTKSADMTTDRSGSLQLRRNFQSAPQLTLNVPSAQYNHRRAPEMVWLPDEQMWLVTDQYERDRTPLLFQESAPSRRPQPSPSIYSYPDTTPPPTPDIPQPRNPFIDAEGLSPIQTQFRSLIIDEERRSPLFQEATSTIPTIDSTIEAIVCQEPEDDWPLYDPTMYEPYVEEPASPESPDTPDSYFDDIEREWNSAVSIASADEQSGPWHSRDTSDQSYHSAVSSVEQFARENNPVDYYPGHGPLWAGIAKSVSRRPSTGTDTWSWAPSTLSPGPSLLGPSPRRQPF